MNVGPYLGIAVGFIGGMVAAFHVGRWIVDAMLRAEPLEHRKSIMRGAAAGALIAMVPALLLGTVVGGTLGAAYAGGVIGIALGTFAVVTALMAVSVALGAWLGRVLATP